MTPEQKAVQSVRMQQWLEHNRDRVREHQKIYGPEYHRRRTLKLLAVQPWRTILIGARQRAKQRNLLFDLDDEWAEKRWTGYCELTGLEFASPETRIGRRRINFSPSIDRINAKGGYTKGNCRFVIWAVNALKRDGTDDEMYLIAVALVQHKAITQRPRGREAALWRNRPLSKQ